MTITIANTKGGVGKSLIASLLIDHLIINKKGDLVVIDGDNQQSLSLWWGRKEDKPASMQQWGSGALDDFKNPVESLPWHVIDVGGRDSKMVRIALLQSDLVVIPLSATGVDADALVDVLRLCYEAQKYNPDMRVKLVFNRMKQTKKDLNELKKMIKDHPQLFGDVQWLENMLHERVSYQRTFGDGMSVLALHEGEVGYDAKAKSETIKLCEEILDEAKKC